MSRKDYVAIARVIRGQVDANALADEPDVTTALRLTAHGIADVFAADNPRFDRDRFLTACGV